MTYTLRTFHVGGDFNNLEEAESIETLVTEFESRKAAGEFTHPGPIGQVWIEDENGVEVKHLLPVVQS